MLLPILLSLWLGVPSAAADFSAEDLEFFEKQVRPVLAAHCYECHSAKSQKPKGGLRVDSRAALLKGGDTGPAVVPNDAKASLLIDAINYGDLYQMPPRSRLPVAEIAILTRWVERGAPWPAESIAVASQSHAFDLQARRAAHWCWQPVQTHAPPAVNDQTWPQHDLDRFILAKLEERGLKPAPPADKRTLIRRLYFDLLGLPPPAEAVARFVQDEAPDALPRLVDELLESPHFGERWARHWMDLVRYAETYGHEFDYPIHYAWRYRDYLIRALNDDVPYDTLVKEHIAGDLIPQPRTNPRDGTNESVIGTGFWFLHESIHAPVDVRMDEANRIDNQIDVFSKTFLALTVSCARCHDHKFDAISTKDFYALAGFLRSSRRHEELVDGDGRIARGKQVAESAHQDAAVAFESWIRHAERLTAAEFMRYLLAAHAATESPSAAARSEIAAEWQLEPHRLERWIEALNDRSLKQPEHPLHSWHELAMQPREERSAARPEARPRSGPPSTQHERDLSVWKERTLKEQAKWTQAQPDYVSLANFDVPEYDGWFVTGDAFDPSPTSSGQWSGLAHREPLLRPGVAHSGRLGPGFQGVLRSPTFTISHRNIYYRVAGTGCEVRLIVDGYTVIEFHTLLFGGLKFNIDAKPGDAGEFRWHRQSGDLGMYLGHRAYIEVLDHGNGWGAIDEILLSDRDSPPPESLAFSAQLAADPACSSLAGLAGKLGERWENAVQRWRQRSLSPDDVGLLNWFLMQLGPSGLSDPGTGKEALATLASARQRLEDVQCDLPWPRRVHAITEGTGANERVFIRGNPRTLGEEAPRQLLTALVGEPSSVTTGSGRWQLAQDVVDPANPLTSRVMVNRLWHYLFGRGIVASVDNFGVLGEKPTHPELLDYLAQQFVREGWSIQQMIRTLVLSRTYGMSTQADPRAVAVDPKNEWFHAARIRRLDGESVRDALLSISGRLDPTLYGKSIPVHITPFMQGRGKPAQSGPVDGAGRRSIYTEIRRNFLPPMLLAFDLPIPFSTIGRRNVSNVPAQALILMNDPLVLELAEQWSRHLLAAPHRTFAERVRQAYLAAFSRPATNQEIEAAREFFSIQGEALGIATEQRESDPQLWTDYGHVLWNAKEFIFLK